MIYSLGSYWNYLEIRTKLESEGSETLKVFDCKEALFDRIYELLTNLIHLPSEDGK